MTTPIFLYFNYKDTTYVAIRLDGMQNRPLHNLLQLLLASLCCHAKLLGLLISQSPKEPRSQKKKKKKAHLHWHSFNIQNKSWVSVMWKQKTNDTVKGYISITLTCIYIFPIWKSMGTVWLSAMWTLRNTKAACLLLGSHSSVLPLRNHLCDLHLISSLTCKRTGAKQEEMHQQDLNI